MSSESANRSRRYVKRRRAEHEQQTRRRITEAAVKLHKSVGPARTTVSGVAREAGVQRATVYRHFPTEEDLFAACSAHFWAKNPLPDISAWGEIRDPEKRLRRALRDIYSLYGRTEPMLTNTSRDAALVPAMDAPRERFLEYLDAAVDVVVAGRSERSRARRRVRAAVGHAFAFATWQSLVRQQGLSEREAVAVMAGAVEAAGRARA